MLMVVAVDYNRDWKESPLIQLDHVLQGAQFSKLRQVKIYVHGKYYKRARRLFAECHSRGILVVE